MLYMPIYRLFVDDEDTGEHVIASNPQDAYTDVAASLPLAHKSVRLEEVDATPRPTGVSSDLPAASRELNDADPGARG
jgi:hypothetical protein